MATRGPALIAQSLVFRVVDIQPNLSTLGGLGRETGKMKHDHRMTVKVDVSLFEVKSNRKIKNILNLRNMSSKLLYATF